MGRFITTLSLFIVLLLTANLAMPAMGQDILVPGDANLDGSVDIADFVILKQNYGVTAGARWETADFNGDGEVNIADFVILKQNYGSMSPQNLILDLGSGVSMHLTKISPGSFMMGSPENELDRETDEGPLREVAITQAFYIGMFEVTQEQYEAVTGVNPSYFSDAGPKAPVENMNWYEAMAFCSQLSLMTGKTVVLPTEAQWEYACRAGGESRYYYGDDLDYSLLDNYAWYAGNSEGTTHLVGQKTPNAWGLYDMHGNVWEWCHDWYAEDYYGYGPSVNPAGPATGDYKILRGGSWLDDPRYCRSAYRAKTGPSMADHHGGIRAVVTLSPQDILTLDLGSGVTMDLVKIPAGSFLMGSPEDEAGRYDDEGPVHEVTISDDYYMGIYEVTQAQYQAVMGYNPSSFISSGMDAPVENVSWYEATEFCARVSQMTGMIVKLPTEAQWEYACRAGTQTSYYFGSDEDLLDQYAWYTGNGEGSTHPVGQKLPNAYGLYDMHGNVLEWCADWYDSSYPSSLPAIDPIGPATGIQRCLRGGNWDDGAARDNRSAHRTSDDPDHQSSDDGFRVIISTSTMQLDLGGGVTMELVKIPAGTFIMGSPENELDRYPSEGPQRVVTLTQPFYMGVYEVTQAQYEAVMGTNPSFFTTSGLNAPADQVSWNAAVEFCNALSQRTGKTVTLPTEAQWEYACRAGSQTRFYYGEDLTCQLLGDYAWYVSNSDGGTHTVGGKIPNQWGLYDMHGNVWEWCQDWWSNSYDNAGLIDPQGPPSGPFRVLRGGGWGLNPAICRSALRGGNVLDIQSNNFGFRVIIMGEE